MKNIDVLPTDKPSRIYLIKSNNKLGITSNNPEFTENFGSGTQNQNIYITNSEEIKEGDWFLNDMNILFKADKNYIENPAKEVYIGHKKIILTTDQDLIKDDVQGIDDEFLEWFVKNPSCEEVEVVEELNMNGKNGLDRARFIYKIIIPKEESKQETFVNEKCFKCGRSQYSSRKPFCLDDFCNKDFYQKPKQETLEEAAEKYNLQFINKEENKFAKEDFINGAKWQISKQDEFTLGFLHWYNTSQDCETYLRRNYPKNITMNGEHYKKVLEINKELLEMYKNTLPR